MENLFLTDPDTKEAIAVELDVPSIDAREELQLLDEMFTEEVAAYETENATIRDYQRLSPKDRYAALLKDNTLAAKNLAYNRGLRSLSDRHHTRIAKRAIDASKIADPKHRQNVESDEKSTWWRRQDFNRILGVGARFRVGCFGGQRADSGDSAVADSGSAAPTQ